MLYIFLNIKTLSYAQVYTLSRSTNRVHHIDSFNRIQTYCQHLFLGQLTNTTHLI